MLVILLVILLLLLLFGGYGRFGRTTPWGWGPSFGPFGFVLLIVLLIWLLGGFR